MTVPSDYPCDGSMKTRSDEQIEINLPALPSAESTTIHLDPLYTEIKPSESSHRVLSTKVSPKPPQDEASSVQIELKLVKVHPLTWPTLLASPDTHPVQASSSRLPPAEASGVEKPGSRGRKNWDKVDVDEEKPDSADAVSHPSPLVVEFASEAQNAGGDAALQTFFSGIYANADDDTKRAMIKSFTESGGTTLSTDWSSIGKGELPCVELTADLAEKTAVRPPEGMYEMKM